MPLVLGTDDLPGVTLARELEIYTEGGFSNDEVLALATLGTARVLRRDDVAGSITVGKVADLVLVDGDPGRRITDVGRVTTVVKDGRVHDAAALLQASGVRTGE